MKESIAEKANDALRLTNLHVELGEKGFNIVKKSDPSYIYTNCRYPSSAAEIVLTACKIHLTIGWEDCIEFSKTGKTLSGAIYANKV
ncbi:MAG: hypothetical protein AAF378_23535 [Cyanobacteria bacterium P01_A01_bin.84]